MKKGMTFTYVFEANSANYGEGIGNITSLKKFTRNDGSMYSYISRQALRYSLIEQLGMDTTALQLDGSVVQFHPDATIETSAETDLFGYFKTGGRGKASKSRSAAVRLSHAVSLEPFQSELDFLTNKGLSDRYIRQGGQKEGMNISQAEIHKSYYAVTFTVDLDRIGVDEGDNVSLPNEEKAERVRSLMRGIKFLYRDIRGRRENLSPLFIIGGVYDIKNAFFENRVGLLKNELKINLVKDTLELDEHIQENTVIGYVKGSLVNDEAIQEQLNPVSVAEFFKHIDAKINEYYEV